MFQLVTIKGQHARIERGYFVAAAIGKYQLLHADGEWSLSGAVLTSDAFHLRQRPLVFAAPYDTRSGQHGEWTFRVEQFSIVAGRVSARLVPLR